MSKIFSIGPGNERLEGYVARLKKWNIECLVDLRSQPYSQYVPQFNREILSDYVKKSNIEYLYFGDKLGGRPPEGFDKYRKSPKFKENIDFLLGKVRDKRVALMCSEFDVTKCHRRFIVEEIVKKGIEVMIIDKDGNASKYLSIEIPRKSKRRKTSLDSKNQNKLTGF